MSCIKKSKDLAVRSAQKRVLSKIFKILTGFIIKILVNYLTDFHEILCAYWLGLKIGLYIFFIYLSFLHSSVVAFY